MLYSVPPIMMLSLIMLSRSQMARRVRSRRNLGQTSSLYLALTAESFFHRRAYEILKGSEGKASAEFFALFGDITV